MSSLPSPSLVLFSSSGAEPPSRPSVDLAALMAFDERLASQAMGLMFSGGHRDEALEWVDRLDPLERACHAPMSKRKLGYAGECSMADWALATGDLEAVRKIAQNERVAVELFEKGAERIAGYCAAAIKEGEDEMAEFLLERLAPVAPKEPSRYLPREWDDLTKESAKSRRIEWFERVLALREAAGHKLVDSWGLARDLFIPEPQGLAKAGWFEPGIRALEKGGCFDWHAMPRVAEAYAKASPPNWERAGEALAMSTRLFEKREAESTSWSRFDAKAQLETVMFWSGSHPRDTAPDWVKLVIGLGVAPFYEEGQKESKEPPALELLSKSRASRDAYTNMSDREATRRERDEKTKVLLEAMIETGASGVDHHYAMTDDRLKGARKISLLALAAVQGFWRSAELLAAHGVDCKTAARQISSHMEPGPEKVKAEAFLEGLALQKVSSKASSARDKRLAKKGDAAPEPVRSIRL